MVSIKYKLNTVKYSQTTLYSNNKQLSGSGGGT